MEKETLTTKEVLDLLGISRATFFKWIRKGYIKAVNYNPLFEKQTALLFSRQDVEDLIKRINSAA